MPQQTTTKTALCRGQAVRLRARRGMTIAIAQGKVRICGAPGWLAEQVFAKRVELSEGCAHVVQESGWISIEALSATEVVCVVEEWAGWHALSRALTVYAAALRRWLQRPVPGTRRG